MPYELEGTYIDRQEKQIKRKEGRTSTTGPLKLGDPTLNQGQVPVKRSHR